MSQETFELANQGIVRTALRPLSERASQRRSLDEHLHVRFPALFRPFSDAFLPVFQLIKFRRGMVIRQEDFLDRSKALEAASL
jgi:hypothetical protein